MGTGRGHTLPWGGGDGRGRNSGNRNLRLLLLKHCRTIYFGNAHYGPVSRGRTVPRNAGFKSVVVAGEPLSGLDTSGRAGIRCGKALINSMGEETEGDP